MSTDTPRYDSSNPQPAHELAYKPGRELRVSSYDNVSSLLVALLILVGFFVTIMFIIWLTTRVWFVDQPRPVLIEDDPGGRGEIAEGIADEMEEPGAEEVDVLIEPQLKETMEAVTDVASSIAATLEAMQGNSALTGHGSGPGSNRASGPGGDGTGQLSRADRWKIRYPPLSEAAYAAMLEGFGIEIGCIGGGRPQIDIISRLAGGTPQHRQVKDDERLYFRQLEGSENRAVDAGLLQAAGIPTANRIIVHLYPAEIENDIAWAEKDFMDANKKTLADIKQTIIGLRSAGANYEFFVIDQTYR
jgi:hypothetical protein